MSQLILKRKSFMTLLETLIAILLASIVLTIVFGFFRELSYLSYMADKKQVESFQIRYFEMRLTGIFDRLVNEKSTARKFFFYLQPQQKDFTDSSSLIFTFNNEVRRDPTFSGDVLGRLYLDQEHRLRLVTWPLHVTEPHRHMHEEILLTDVYKISYRFYAAPDRTENKNAVVVVNSQKSENLKETQPERDKWQEEWPITHNQMPSILEITLDIPKDPKVLQQAHPDEKNIQKLILRFVLPSSKNFIYYTPEGQS